MSCQSHVLAVDLGGERPYFSVLLTFCMRLDDIHVEKVASGSPILGLITATSSLGFLALLYGISLAPGTTVRCLI